MDIDAIIKPYVERAGTIGILQVGSSVRPWVDEESDVDLMVIVEDEVHAQLSVRKRHVIGVDRGPPRRKSSDVLIHSWRQIASYVDSPHDAHHHAFQFARVLFDPQRRLADILPRLRALSPAIVEVRQRVHYNEAFWFRLKTERCEKRGNRSNAQFTGFLSLFALSRLLFVLQGSWASFPDWTTLELRHLGVPEPIMQLLERALAAPTCANLDPLFHAVDAWLEARGLDFHDSPMELGDWTVFDDEGIAASRKWGMICG